MPQSVTREQAKALGLQFYCTGRPCQRGHYAERYTSTRQCVVCHAIWNRQEKRRPYDKEYRANHREERSMYHKVYYVMHREKWTSRNRAKRPPASV